MSKNVYLCLNMNGSSGGLKSDMGLFDHQKIYDHSDVEMTNLLLILKVANQNMFKTHNLWLVTP